MNFDEQVKSGMVAIVGPPNAGKSTLMNTLLGQKISIVSPKPQTTRNRIAGIMNSPDYQIVLLDTPGLHKAREPLNLEMVRIAMETLSEVDAVLYLVDVSLPLPEKKKYSLKKHLSTTNRPVILLLNKIDLLAKEKLLPLIQAYQELYDFSAIIPVSALLGTGTDILTREMLNLLPVGPRLYPEDIPTDVSERFIVAEIIREKIFLLTSQELPYSVAVAVDAFQEDDIKKMTTIHATIFVEKASQKGIIIGKGGRMLTRIGSQARHDVEILLNQKVLLKLWVKVKKQWTQDLRFIRELG
jgi:GTP-binding protein Era